MNRKEEKNMNGALIKRMLQLIPTDYKADFKMELAENPNMTFQEALLWFHNRYGMADKNHRDDRAKEKVRDEIRERGRHKSFYPPPDAPQKSTRLTR